MYSTSDKPTLLENHPPSLSLPDELWVNILLELDYFELKKASRICKKLQRFTLDSKFDRVLFRAIPPSPPLQAGERLTIHPALENTECIVHEFDRHCIYSEKGNEFFLKDLPHLLDETATSPASAILQISLPAAGTPRSLSRQTGVTLHDVMKELARFWNSKPMLLSWGYHGYDDDGDNPATQFEALYEHNGCGIGGWDKCVAEGENHTKLVIDHGFDS